VDHGSGAHGAGLEGDEEGAAVEAMVAEGLAGGAEGDDFGVGGGIVVAHDAILGADEDLVALDDDGADGYFAGLTRGDGFIEGALEIFKIGHLL
jgi:hypothetical protein